MLTVSELVVGKKGSTKDLIVALLSHEWPLTAKEIFRRTQKESDSAVSYQAVHKVLGELEDNFIVEKLGRSYALNTEWIQKSKDFFTQMDTSYKNKIGKYEIDPNFEGTTTFKFTSFTDLCVTTAKLLTSLVLTTPEDKGFICTMEYGWWAFKFRFEHLALLFTMVKNNPKATGIIRKDTPFGRWIGSQYTRVGGCSAPVGTKVPIDNDVFVQGDCIIEVEFSDETKKMFEQYYNKWHNLEDNFKEFGLKEEPRIDATVKITRNPSMAKFMKNELEKYRKGAKK
jgi:hypothetical protein